MNYQTKDSGDRVQFQNGGQRDTEAGKPRFNLLLPKDIPYDQQMLTRWAGLMARGAEKYDARNWEKFDSEVELERAKSSALRHMMQLICGEDDEDHAAAVMFNVTVIEYIKYKQLQHDSVESCIDCAETKAILSMNDHVYRDPKVLAFMEEKLREITFDDIRAGVKSFVDSQAETPWTEQEHSHVESDLWEVVEPDGGFDFGDAGDENILEACEQLIVENHPDFAWVWEECPKDLGTKPNCGKNVEGFDRKLPFTWTCSRAKNHKGECHAHGAHSKKGTCLMRPH